MQTFDFADVVVVFFFFPYRNTFKKINLKALLMMYQFSDIL